MASYKELKAKAEELVKQADTVRKTEIASIVSEIRAKMVEFGITLADLRETRRRRTKKSDKKGAKRSTSGKKVAPKYRDPATGQTWSGRGKEPKWLAAYLNKGLSLMELGRKDEALSVFKLLVGKFPLENETKVAQQKIKDLISEDERHQQPEKTTTI